MKGPDMTNKREQLLNEIEDCMTVANMWWDMWQNSNKNDTDAYNYWMQDEYKVKGLCDAYEIVYGVRLYNKGSVLLEKSQFALA